MIIAFTSALLQQMFTEIIITKLQMSGYILLLSWFIEISELNANIIDTGQRFHSAASDLGLHCLLMSILWDAKLKWVKLI